MRKGFTLIELLIVLAVIAALMAVATPLALNAVKNAKASQVAQNLRALKTAVETYFYTEKEVPTSIDSVTSYLSSNFAKSDYELNPSDNDLSDGLAKINVYYNKTDVTADLVIKNLPEATEVSDKPGIVIDLRKYW